jgi:hypothetical protein
MINIKKMKTYLRIIIFLLSFSCAGQKKDFITKGDHTTAINNATNDFYKTSLLSKKDTSFSVSYKHIDADIIEVSIIGNSNKFYLDGEKPLNQLPTNYIEYNNKVFYWYDDNNKSNSNTEIINKLKQYKLIEYNADVLEYNIDDKKKGISYYFCIKDLTKYKKVKSNSSKNQTPKSPCK